MIKSNALKKRIKRIRSNVIGTANRPRLSVFRSNKYIYAQLIDDQKGHTIAAVSEREIPNEKETTQKHRNDKDTEYLNLSVMPKKYSKLERAKLTGELLAQKAIAKKIKTIVFDRHGYKYHGRVKALADQARTGGLEF